MEKLSIPGVEAVLDVEDYAVGICLQIDGDSHWATLTIQRKEDIAELRDWLAEYCEKAGIA
jgi:hypothetical protein